MGRGPPVETNRDNSVSKVTDYGLDNWVSTSQQGQGFLSSPPRSDLLWVVVGTGGSFPGGNAGGA
jgi:hypothetical protein